MSATSSQPPNPPGPPFSGATIDRAAELRHDPAQIAALLAGAEPLAVACDASHVLVDAGGARLARSPWQGDPDGAVILGIEDGRALIGIDIAEAANGSAPTQKLSLREAGTALSPSESGLAAYLVALLGWHRKHPHCSVCGTATRVSEAGLARHCPNCGATHFPRTDPVVIMTVESEGALLMGSRSGWPSERYSVLAGFISPGETPEEAVVREVHEESGVRARDAIYVASQPWPFPASLMLGFHAQAEPGQLPEPGGDGELEAVRWFPREEIIAMQRGEAELLLPPEISIARVLIDAWVARSAA
jgi:NAD+ diphosphatase